MQGNVKENKERAGNVKSEPPQSLEIASRGINTSKDFANLMCSLMADVLAGKVTPVVANAVCNAGGKTLKLIELEYKYGQQGGASRILQLTTPVTDVLPDMVN